MIPLIGYGDRLSVRPGETIEFKVSSQNPAPFEASLVRIVCADPHLASTCSLLRGERVDEAVTVFYFWRKKYTVRFFPILRDRLNPFPCRAPRDILVRGTGRRGSTRGGGA